MIKLKKDFTYSLVVPTSMGVRITAWDRQPTHISDTFFMQATSAETNVATIPSSLGLKVKALTAFVKDSPIASFIKNDLSKRRIEFEGREFEQDGPWGLRHQFNIADSGYGTRGPIVHNDRTGEVGKLLNIKDFKIEKLFKDEGVQILHISGLIVALSKDTSEFCESLAYYAKKYNTIISFDINHRASFWKGREKELKESFKKIANLSDILIGNEEDFQLALDVKGPEAGGKNLAENDFKLMIENAKEIFKNTTVFATTLRKVIDANNHLWGAIMFADNKYYFVEPKNINVLDRIGGGDGFVGGLLYSTLKEFDYEKQLSFAWGCGAYATTIKTDYAFLLSEEQIWNIVEGNARIKR